MRNKIEHIKAISETNRVRILMMLLEKPMCVCEIRSVLGLTTATVSNHLSILRKEGFIEDEKDGKWIIYRIAEKADEPIVRNIINSLSDWFGNDTQIVSDKEKVKSADRYIICGEKDEKQGH